METDVDRSAAKRLLSSPDALQRTGLNGDAARGARVVLSLLARGELARHVDALLAQGGYEQGSGE